MPAVLTAIPGGRAADASAATEGLAGLQKFIAEQAVHHKFTLQDVAVLHADVTHHAALRGLDSRKLEEAVVNAFDRVSKANTHVGATDIASAKKVTLEHVLDAAGIVQKQSGKFSEARPAVMEQLKKNIASNAAHDEAAKAASKSKDWASKIATSDKVSIGISAILAAMMITASAAQMKQIFSKDEQGNTHFNGTSFAWAAAEALLGAGMGYLAHSQFKAVAR